ncbi:hypothetical protein [Sodalis praecaptivus]|uniref:hypothetical protein n=1 Tax=Sodalis TaxID=84565 RepID=UPI00046C8FFF|nr:hypothetical protein [Sodalis praecaptivus]
MNKSVNKCDNENLGNVNIILNGRALTLSGYPYRLFKGKMSRGTCSLEQLRHEIPLRISNLMNFANFPFESFRIQALRRVRGGFSDYYPPDVQRAFMAFT